MDISAACAVRHMMPSSSPWVESVCSDLAPVLVSSGFENVIPPYASVMLRLWGVAIQSVHRLHGPWALGVSRYEGMMVATHVSPKQPKQQ